MVLAKPFEILGLPTGQATGHACNQQLFWTGELWTGELWNGELWNGEPIAGKFTHPAPISAVGIDSP